MIPTITPVYAALLALLMLWLSLNVIAVRRSEGVSLGDGGSKLLERRIRAQGNCAEYAPIGLLLLLMAELQGSPAWVVHGLGATLLIGRGLHAFALSSLTPRPLPRMLGMVLTFTMLSLGAATLLINAVA